MKKFLLTFLGTLAGIWISLLIICIGLSVILVAVGVSTLSGVKSMQIKSGSYLELTLAGEITDRPGRLDPIGALRGEDNRTQGLDEIVGAIRLAADDDRIEGIVLDCRGSQLGLVGRQAIIEALKNFKSAAPSKWIYSYADIYTQGDYYIATASDSIFINPIGQVSVNGLSSTEMYFKKLLDNLGVQIQVVKVGTYKSAVEPFIHDGISQPAREQQELYLTNIWTEVASQMAEGRDVSTDTVNGWADAAIYAMPTPDYVSAKVVDRLMYRHEFDDKIAALTGKDSSADLTPVSPSEYCSIKDINQKGDGRGANIAVLYACGEITDEIGDGIVSARLVPQILALAEDKDIDGLVMYVNSVGGSTFASEQIWEALEQWKSLTGKPFYVSMSDYAASGGYYISCGADRIYARPATLTGSIGIYALIPDISRLMSDKIGITTSTVSTNPSGMLPTILEPMTPAQRNAMQGYVDRGYELFTARCAAGRGMSQDSIKAIAEGRIWDGAEALKLGLVDELGGLDDAIAGMAKQLNVSTWTVRNYPERKNRWYDIILEAGSDIRAQMVRAELGDMAPVYETVSRIRNMSVLQSRMDMFEINL